MHSHHNFIFPFEWTLNQAGQPLSEEQNNLAVCAKYMAGDRRWSRVVTKDKPATKTQYNEAIYFYDFVRPAMFDSGTADSLLCHFQMLLPADTTLGIQKGAFEAKLRVFSVDVRLYGMGVGVLSLQMFNDRADQADPETVLKINQYGRRLFPPFYNIRYPNAFEESYYKEDTWSEGLENHPELPDKIYLAQQQNDEEKILWAETFQGYPEGPELNQTPGIFQYLFPAVFVKNIRIAPVLDDRMFVLCWYANDEIARDIKQIDSKKSETSPSVGEAPAALPNTIDVKDWWYRYLFVDISRTVQHEQTMDTLLRQHTYYRWADWGTLYGVARYSFVCLVTKGAPAFLLAHVKTLYTRMAELALVQRACILRFSGEVTAISTLATKDPQLPVRMASLFRQHLRFVNKIYFREITAQEQGIELYELLRQSMRLQEQLTGLEKEIAELHNYAASIAADERNEKLDMLTYIGALIGIPTFISTLYTIVGYEVEKHPWWPVMWVYVLSTLSGIGIIAATNKTFRIVCVILLIFTICIGCLLIPFCNQ